MDRQTEDRDVIHIFKFANTGKRDDTEIGFYIWHIASIQVKALRALPTATFTKKLQNSVGYLCEITDVHLSID